jgi:hypothetical protein
MGGEGKVNTTRTKAYVTNDEIPLEFVMDVTLVYY